MAGPYINDPGFELPENNILVITNDINGLNSFNEIVEPLVGKIKRDWFTDHFYYCLPLNIGNQYGFIIKSLRTFDLVWDDTVVDHTGVKISFLDNNENNDQVYTSSFGSGILTIQNSFHFKTPIGINLMAFQPPNMFIPGIQAMTGVIETDQLRRDFTFNLKITDPNRTIRINAGDAIGAFIPIPRNFVEKFEVKHVSEVYDKSLHVNELADGQELARQRMNEDKQKTHMSGRKYFSGTHAFGEKYADHQKRLI